MPWSGDADVHVSIVNWIKGSEDGKKRLYIQEGADASAGWRHEDRDKISSALSFGFDVTKAKALSANARSDACFQGQTHGHKGFLLTPSEADAMKAADPKHTDVIFPFLIANTLFSTKSGLPDRYVIDFGDRDILSAGKYGLAFERIEALVLPTRKNAAAKEKKQNAVALAANAGARVNHHHENFLNQWWRMSYRRADMMAAIGKIDRYIVCGQVTKRPIFEFISKDIHPNAALVVFPRDDDYTFGILQSSIHWSWFTERCSTLTERYRYTSNTVFDSFPWPQSASLDAVKRVADSAKNLRSVRRKLLSEHNLSLRELYRSAELPGLHPMDAAQEQLDDAVRKAYGMKTNADPLKFLFDLNQHLAKLESEKTAIVGPGIPAAFSSDQSLRSEDCLKMP